MIKNNHALIIAQLEERKAVISVVYLEARGSIPRDETYFFLLYSVHSETSLLNKPFYSWVGSAKAGPGTLRMHILLLSKAPFLKILC